MAFKFEEVHANLVRTNGLFRRPNLRTRAWICVRFVKELQE